MESARAKHVLLALIAAACVLLVVCMFAQPARAATDKADAAKSAYQNFVASHATKSYQIVDIDDDGIPELIRRNWPYEQFSYGGGESYVYSYATGKVKRLAKMFHGKCGKLYYNTKKKMFGFYGGGTGHHDIYKFYKLKNSQVVKRVKFSMDDTGYGSSKWKRVFKINGAKYKWVGSTWNSRIKKLNNKFDKAVKAYTKGCVVLE